MKISTIEDEPAIHSRPGWKCDVVLTISNSGDRDLEDPEAPGSGAMDAIWDVHVTVPGHSSQTVRLPVGWNPTGCNSAGSLAFHDWRSWSSKN